MDTSFAEAVRIFARQSILAGGMPFRPTLQKWEELTEAEIDRKRFASEGDLQAGRIFSQESLDSGMKEKLRNDVILDSVDEERDTVYLRFVCTKGKDLTSN